MPSPKPVSVSVFRTGSIILAALMVTGCATVPHASTDTPVAMSDLAASQSLIGDARGQWPAQEWWTCLTSVFCDVACRVGKPTDGRLGCASDQKVRNSSDEQRT